MFPENPTNSKSFRILLGNNEIIYWEKKNQDLFYDMVNKSLYNEFANTLQYMQKSGLVSMWVLHVVLYLQGWMSQHPSSHQFQNETFVLPLKTLIFPSFYCILWKIITTHECSLKFYKQKTGQNLHFFKYFNVPLTCKFCNIPWFSVHPWQNSINFHLEQKTVMLSEEDIQHSTAQHGFPLQ